MSKNMKHKMNMKDIFIDGGQISYPFEVMLKKLYLMYIYGSIIGA